MLYGGEDGGMGGGMGAGGINPFMMQMQMAGRRRRRPRAMAHPGLMSGGMRGNPRMLANPALVAGMQQGDPRMLANPTMGTAQPGITDPNGQMGALGAAYQAQAGAVPPGMPPGNDYSGAIDKIRGLAGRHARGQMQVGWGGQHFTDPNKLWGWEQQHGNTMGKGEFWRLHPDAARRLGMPVHDEAISSGDPMDANQLRSGIIGQLTAAQGALTGSPAHGMYKPGNMLHHAARRKMHAVGVAQGRAQALAQIMSRRLRGGRGGV